MIEFRGVREALSLRTVRPEMVSLLKLCAVWSNRSGFNLRVNSLHDHKHSKNSLHYQDLAADFSISHKNGRPNRAAMRQLAEFLRDHLAYGFDVVFNTPDRTHDNHVHVEWDENARQRAN